MSINPSFPSSIFSLPNTGQSGILSSAPIPQTTGVPVAPSQGAATSQSLSSLLDSLTQAVSSFGNSPLGDSGTAQNDVNTLQNDAGNGNGKANGNNNKNNNKAKPATPAAPAVAGATPTRIPATAGAPNAAGAKPAGKGGDGGAKDGAAAGAAANGKANAGAKGKGKNGAAKGKGNNGGGLGNLGNKINALIRNALGNN